MLRPHSVTRVAIAVSIHVVMWAVCAAHGMGLAPDVDVAGECIADGTCDADTAAEAAGACDADYMPSVRWHACNIDRFTGDNVLDVAHFRRVYKGRRPVVFSTAPRCATADHSSTSASASTVDSGCAPSPNAEFRRAVARRSLLEQRGHLPVVLSSSNSYSHDKRRSTLARYIRRHVSRKQTANALANETFYLVRVAEPNPPVACAQRERRWRTVDAA